MPPPNKKNDNNNTKNNYHMGLDSIINITPKRNCLIKRKWAKRTYIHTYIPDKFEDLAVVVLDGSDSEKVPKGGPILLVIQQPSTIRRSRLQRFPYLCHVIRIRFCSL